MNSRIEFWFALTANCMGLVVLLGEKVFDKWMERKYERQLGGGKNLDEKIAATERRIASKEKILAATFGLLLLGWLMATVGLIGADITSNKKETTMIGRYVELEARVKKIEDYLWRPSGDPGGPRLSDRFDSLDKAAKDLGLGLELLRVSKADSRQVEKLLPLIRNMRKELDATKKEIKTIKGGGEMTMEAEY